MKQPPQQQQPYGQQQHGGQQGYQPQPYGAQPPYELPSTGAGAQRPPGTSLATDPELLFSILKETTTENNLATFYDDARLRQLAAQIGRTDPVTTICNRWDIPLEIAFDLVKLALYDIVFLLDDSGSIEFSKLQNELKSLLKSAAFASSLFDQDGFSVRFLNSTVEGDGIRTETQAEDLVSRVKFQGVTPLVTSLRDKILRKYLGEVHEPTPNIKKPLLVIIITDGMVRYSSLFAPLTRADKLFSPQTVPAVNSSVSSRNIRSSVCCRCPMRPTSILTLNVAIAFQIAQVGVDTDAQDFLASLDSDPEVGSMIDCTSSKSTPPALPHRGSH